MRTIFRASRTRFRPGRNQHQALDALLVGLTRRRVNWVLDLDIRGFFDNLDHEWIMQFLQHRVAEREGAPPDPEMAHGGSVRGGAMD
jgi:RNA-directed DNA polymerase